MILLDLHVHQKPTIYLWCKHTQKERFSLFYFQKKEKKWEKMRSRLFVRVFRGGWCIGPTVRSQTWHTLLLYSARWIIFFGAIFEAHLEQLPHVPYHYWRYIEVVQGDLFNNSHHQDNHEVCHDSNGCCLLVDIGCCW